jgi:hypothetical protein
VIFFILSGLSEGQYVGAGRIRGGKHTSRQTAEVSAFAT